MGFKCYGSETWPMTAMEMKRRNAWEREILRRINGPVVEEGLWRMRSKQELRGLCRYLDIETDSKKRKLEWMGHVVRMEHGRIVKKIFERKLEVRRRIGRPRLRWLEDIEKD
jgi:hypothetical protein